MYFIDFFKHAVKKGNVPVFIYLGVNLAIIAFLFGNTFQSNWFVAFLLSVVIYIGSLIVALSPIGEWILRLQTGCKQIKRKEHVDLVNPIFEEVYEKAKLTNPSISNDVKLFMTSDESANAFATGRKTICITRGMLQAPEDEIKAVISHEMGHLAHKDTDLILVVSIGNFIVTAIFVGIRLFARLTTFVFRLAGILGGEVVIDLGALISGFIIDVLLVFFMSLWTKFGMMLVMKSSRSNEYSADRFAADLGYGVPLCRFLDRFDAQGFQGLFASLMSSHPEKDQRIAELQEYGVPYTLERA